MGPNNFFINCIIFFLFWSFLNCVKMFDHSVIFRALIRFSVIFLKIYTFIFHLPVCQCLNQIFNFAPLLVNLIPNLFITADILREKKYLSPESWRFQVEILYKTCGHKIYNLFFLNHLTTSIHILFIIF